MKENEMGNACVRHRGKRSAKYYFATLRREYNLEVLGVDGKIVRKRDVAVLGYENVELIHLVQEWVWWQALLKAIMYFPAALNAEFLDNTKD
jgi:hypothetical protein